MRTTSTRNGVEVLAQAVRVMVDPALNQGLVDNHGVQTAPRNDGTTNPQATPIYLFIDALKGVDAAFAAWAQAHPNDDRQPGWRAARSQMVDTALPSRAASAVLVGEPRGPAILLPCSGRCEAQILAQCPDRSSRPRARGGRRACRRTSRA